MAFLNHNGQLIDAASFSIPVNNRAFNYGDGFFESMLFENAECKLWTFHELRIKKSADLLQLTASKTEDLLTAVKKTLKANKLEVGRARVRLTVYRDEGGLYSPTSNGSQYLIETKKLSAAKGKDVDFGIKLATFKDWPKPIHPLFSIKSINAGLYVQASLAKASLKCDDVVLLNSRGEVCETSSCNIFMVKNKVAFTPPLSSGCVDGTFRAFLLAQDAKLGVDIQEKTISPSDLLEADEVFLTNAVSGIIPVSEIEGYFLSHQYTGFLESLIFD